MNEAKEIMSGFYKPPIDVKLHTPEELVSEWVDTIKSDVDRPLTTGIDSFDKILRNRLRGKVIAYVGYGGTKKSLMALHALRINVRTYENQCTGVYSNMEMSSYQFMSRLIDMSFETEDKRKVNMSYLLEDMLMKAYRAGNTKEIKRIQTQIGQEMTKLYGRNMLISNQSRATVDHYDKMIKKAKQEKGEVDMLVIDGLSMMDGVGNEVEKFTTSSGELKELAKQHNIYIPLICHCKRGASLHERDTTQFIRGTEKILDNVDGVIMHSLVIDDSKGTDKTIEYREDKGYLRLYDKRGTGRKKNVIYDFHPHELGIVESPDDPALYEVEVQKKKVSF